MKPRSGLLACSVVVWAIGLSARQPEIPGCGTHDRNAKEELFLHYESLRSRGVQRSTHLKSIAAAAAATTKDYGNIAVIEDTDGVIARRNVFNVDQKTITFTPSSPGAARYGVKSGAASFDRDAALRGAPLSGLGDDDTRRVPIPFPFPFFGSTYRSVFINSDGNLTFGSGDANITDRSLGRMVAGPPRIAPLFSDLDPSSASAANGVTVLSEAARLVVTWVATPLWQSVGIGPEQTFQVRIYSDGRIEFSYNGAGSGVSDAVVGIAPGATTGTVSIVSLTSGNPDDFSGAVVERFSSADAVDIATTAQKFYATHEDAYDYLAIYNASGVAASPSAIAYEVTARNHRTGYGDEVLDIGAEFGSPRRLQAVMNMGPLSQYPSSPIAHVDGRGPTADTPVTILGHEAGHLFLAFTSVPGPGDPTSTPMLGRAGVHWAFTFNSEASLLEGNRIQDNGSGAAPRFMTVENVKGYSPLDQYLMGFRAPADVPDTFVVVDSGQSVSRSPQNGIGFNGDRLNVGVDDIIAVAGRRTPDYTVAQRRFRFAFVLIVPAGATPAAAQIAQVDAYRTAFEQAYASFASGRAFADTSLKHAAQFSAAPALGVVQGGTAAATITLDSAAGAPATFFLEQGDGSTGSITAPASVTIPAGSSRASFSLTGTRAGVVELSARPADTTYETGNARIQVLGSAAGLKLAVVSGDSQPVTAGSRLPNPVVVQATDINQLPYPGVRVTATVSTGSLDSGAVVTDENGMAAFRWTPGATGPYELRASIDGTSAPAVVAQALGRPVVLANGIGNAASFTPGITPGSLATIFGTSMAAGITAQASNFPLPYSVGGVEVLVNNAPAQVIYASDGQINFLVPADLSGSTADIMVVNPASSSISYKVNVLSVSPGIFFDGTSGNGAVLISGTTQTTFDHPAGPGDTLEIYSTGLGPTVAAGSLQTTIAVPQVLIGGLPATVLFSGLSPQFPGLYQINASVPQGVPSGVQKLSVAIGGAKSNEVKIRLQ
jgi:uncharacterized protein (TIGR03437 family)